MNTVLLRLAMITLVAVGLSVAGCEQNAPTSTKSTATPGGPPAPPPPPGGTAATPSPAVTPAPAAAATSGLPADLVQKIDALIQSHKDYSAAAEKVQDGQGAKDRFDELSAIAQRSSDAYDDVMIGTKQLSPAQMVLFEAYMNQHVSPVWEVRKQHQARLESLLPR
jgi:hypothetical protein